MFVMSKGLCFGCYALDQNIKSCPKKRICKKEGCCDNRHQAVQRAMSMRKHFKDQQFYGDYFKFMKNITEKGYAKEVAIITPKDFMYLWPTE